MAIVEITILKGRSQEKKERVIKGVTEVLMKEIDPDPSHIRVIIHETEPGDYAVGGESLLKKGAKTPGVD